MSVDLFTQAWRLQMQPRRKIIAMVLAEAADDAGYVRMTLPEMSDRGAMREPHAIRALRELHFMGGLHIVGPDTYRLILDMYRVPRGTKL